MRGGSRLVRNAWKILIGQLTDRRVVPRETLIKFSGFHYRPAALRRSIMGRNLQRTGGRRGSGQRLRKCRGHRGVEGHVALDLLHDLRIRAVAHVRALSSRFTPLSWRYLWLVVEIIPAGYCLTPPSSMS